MSSRTMVIKVVSTKIITLNVQWKKELKFSFFFFKRKTNIFNNVEAFCCGIPVYAVEARSTYQYNDHIQSLSWETAFRNKENTASVPTRLLWLPLRMKAPAAL